MRKKIKLILLGVFITVSSILSLAYTDHYFEIAKHLDIFTSVYKELNTFYVDETNPGKLMKKGIDSMLKSLDPYTTYIPESQMEDFRFMTTGQYGGIGAVITKRDDYVYISEPYEGFPAQKAGLLAGDKIIEINGISAKDKTTEEVSKILKGAPNTTVNLLIERKRESKPLEVSFNREKITIGSVPYYGFVSDSIGYIKLRTFTKNCSKDVRDAFQSLRKKQDLSGLILDLRSNPGGLLNESVDIANFFIDKGEEIVSTKGKIKTWEKSYKAINTPLDTKIPLVVLIDQSSASASEIVSGAIQDLDRGVIIGQRSYGKGLVQQTRKLSYNSQLKLTVAKYYIPSGRCIQALDYTNRNKDGSVGKIADSLVTMYETRNGRPVYDGGGITPDIITQKDNPSNIILSLFKERLFFDFATEYRLDNPSIAEINEYAFSENDFQLFISFLSDKEYQYETETEESLKLLRKTAEEEGYFEGLTETYNTLEKVIQSNKLDDLERSKSALKEILGGEIASRYYYQKGRIQSLLVTDREVLAAIEILENETKYNEILSVDDK